MADGTEAVVWRTERDINACKNVNLSRTTADIRMNYKAKGLLCNKTELRGCVKVEVAVLGSLSLIIFMVSVDVKQH